MKIVIILHERGIPSKRMSSSCIEYVSGLCTHRPSLLPIDYFDEYWGVLVKIYLYKDEPLQITVIRGSKSRNKVSVEESADGSFYFLTFFVLLILGLENKYQ